MLSDFSWPIPKLGGGAWLTAPDLPVFRRSRKLLPLTSINGGISLESGRSFERCYDLGDRVKTTRCGHSLGILLRHLSMRAVTLLLAYLLVWPAISQTEDVLTQYSNDFAECWTAYEAECAERLFHAENDLASSPLIDRRSISETIKRFDDLYDFERFEVMPPWQVFSSSYGLTAIVPYVRTVHRKGIDEWMEHRNYLFATSDDDGDSWDFIVHRRVPQSDLDYVALEHYGVLPEDRVYSFFVQPLSRSRFLRTVDKRFALRDQSQRASYELELEVRRRIRNNVALTVYFSDPVNPETPYYMNSVISPEQEWLSIQSPEIDGFQTGFVYSVMIVGIDDETGEEILEHQQEIMFYPPRDIRTSSTHQSE